MKTCFEFKEEYFQKVKKKILNALEILPQIIKNAILYDDSVPINKTPIEIRTHT